MPFPDSTFAWIFYLALVGFVAVAAYIDLAKAKIPNKLTVTMLAVGLGMNLIRGAWLGADNRAVWVLDSGGTGIGLADGFLFSLAGFAVAFAVLTGLWMITQTGAGDVKLFAALGGWIGIKGFVYVWILSLPLLMCWFLIRFVFAGSSIKQEKRDAKRSPSKRKWSRVTYSLPIAISVVLSGLWLCREGLQLVPPKSPPPATGTNGSPDGPPSPNTN